jgi:hypothetical protein
MATKTPEEIEALKANWRKDPCWDIEDTEGFEEIKAELELYRLEFEAECERRNQEEKAKRAEIFKAETGISDPKLMDSLNSFSEIAQLIVLDPVSANAFATLLLAAQMKRIADVLEANDGDNGFLVSSIGRYEH